MDENQKKFAIQALRRASYKWPSRYNTMKKARVARGKYECALCKGVFARKDVQMDHVLPVVDPVEGYVNLDVYTQRMLPYDDGWNCLCTECHNNKTQGENVVRRSSRAEKNSKRRAANKRKKAFDPKTNKHLEDSLDDLLNALNITPKEKA